MMDNADGAHASSSGARGVAIGGSASGATINTGDVTNIQGNFVQQQPPPPSLLHTIPAPVPDFTGRLAELETLRQLTAAHHTLICGIRGLGGIGKTQLACKLAAELAPLYPDAQLKLDLAATTTPLTPEETLARVITAFRPELKPPEDLPSLRNLYLSLLHDQRVLILADNAQDAAQVRPLLPPPGSLLLITSRAHFALEGLQSYHLETMSDEDAQALLLTICPRLAGPPNHAPALARSCGHLPLALRAAASLLSVTPDLTPADYLQLLADESHRLETLGTEGVEITVEASLTLSYQTLPPDTQRVFRALSVFPATFDAPAEEYVCQDPAHKNLSEFLRLSLVDFDEQSRRYRLHDLTRLFARRYLAESGNEREQLDATMFHAARYAVVLADANKLYMAGNDKIAEGLALFDRERHNIEAGRTRASAHATEDTRSANLTNAYPNVGAHVLNIRLHARQMIQCLEAALAAARFLNDRQSEGIHLGNIGLAYANLGETPRAIERYQQALAIAREIGNRHGEGSALGNLGTAYANAGEPCKAIEFYQQALVIEREIGDRRNEGNALGALGTAYMDVGEPRKAIEFFQQHLIIACEIGDRYGEGNASDNLGIAYAALRERRKAIEFFQQHLIIARELGDRRGEGIALGNLGVVYMNFGEPCKAVEFYQQQLTISREIGDHRGAGYALGNLGLVYADLGETSKSAELFEQTSVIAREIGDRRGEGIAYFDMALAYYQLGRRDQAIPLAQHALAIYRQIEDPHAAKVEQKLAQWQAQTEPPPQNVPPQPLNP